LAVLLPTDDPAALSYVKAKQRAAEAVGITVDVHAMGNPTTDAIVAWVDRCEADDSVSGILIETPLPAGVDLGRVRQALPAAKDVDGVGVESFGCLADGGGTFYPPATAQAALHLATEGGCVSGHHSVVLGRSVVVGRPLALLLLARDATVTVCHSKTRDLASLTRQADFLFAAIGQPGFVTGEMVKPGAVVIDIGTTVQGKKVIGDVDAASVQRVAAAWSPVPGGVGPLTTALLLQHVVDAAERRVPRGECATLP
jgi:methylenetetrahydrofolate dehydrogenase (NADP+)/methenyltetrahydrofolate cyclohydrolase